jgi:excisionase family DNA binding protein
LSTHQQKLAYDLDEGAELIGSNRSALYAAINSGDLISFKDGRRRRVSHAALMDFIARKEAESQPTRKAA